MMRHNGLKNDSEQNCFLNSLLQIFVNISSIRENIFQTPPAHTCKSPCLNCEIQNLLINLFYSSSSCSSAPVRSALVSETNSSRTFYFSEKACVNELFEVVLNYYHEFYIENNKVQETDCSNLCFAHSLFGLEVSVLQNCCKLSQITHKYTHLSICGETALSYFRCFGEKCKLSAVLNAAILDFLNFKQKKCECQEAYSWQTRVAKLPNILAISLYWADRNLKQSHKLISFVNQELYLEELFECDDKSSARVYRFRGMVCFSKFFQHYFTICCDETYKRWSYLDDTRVVTLKSWFAFKFSLKMFKLTPVLLFYQVI